MNHHVFDQIHGYLEKNSNEIIETGCENWRAFNLDGIVSVVMSHHWKKCTFIKWQIRKKMSTALQPAKISLLLFCSALFPHVWLFARAVFRFIPCFHCFHVMPIYKSLLKLFIMIIIIMMTISFEFSFANISFSCTVYKNQSQMNSTTCETVCAFSRCSPSHSFWARTMLNRQMNLSAK